MLQFEFNGHTSDEYGLIVTRIEENDTLVNRSLQLGEKNKYRPKENQFGTLYGDNYSFKMGVMRNPCRNKNVVPELKNGILRYDPTYTPYLDNGILKFSMNYTADIKNGIIIPNDSDYLTSNNIRIINASHDADTSSTTITKMQGKSITLYFIQQDGEYTTDRYVTESWINEQNFASADSVKEYVSNIIEETVLDVLDEHIDSALDRKLGGIDSEDLTNIFQGGN